MEGLDEDKGSWIPSWGTVIGGASVVGGAILVAPAVMEFAEPALQTIGEKLGIIGSEAIANAPAAVPDAANAAPPVPGPSFWDKIAEGFNQTVDQVNTKTGRALVGAGLLTAGGLALRNRSSDDLDLEKLAASVPQPTWGEKEQLRLTQKLMETRMSALGGAPAQGPAVG